MRFPSVVLGALLLASATPGAGHTAAAAAAAAPVGMTRLSVPGATALRGDASNRLRVVVWYPAAATATLQPIEVGPPGNALFREGEAAVDAQLAPSPSRFPFVVVSHGTGGTSMDLSWLCAGLAANGYIVASLDHPGNNALDPPTVAGTTLWWMRANDLSRTIDGVLADPRFGQRIDPERIGAAGFSIGGTTVLILVGARSNYAALDAYCKSKPEAQSCNGAATPGIPDIAAKSVALAASNPSFQAAIAQGSQTHRDPRVKAVFAIAPAVGPALVAQSLSEISIPIAVVAGGGDPVVPPVDNAIPDALALPNATLTLLPKSVAHYTFLTDRTESGRARIPLICQDIGPARLAVHHTTLDLALAFFARTLGK